MKFMDRASLLAVAFAICSAQAQADTANVCSQAQSQARVASSLLNMASDSLKAAADEFSGGMDPNDRADLVCRVAKGQTVFKKVIANFDQVESLFKKADLKNAACLEHEIHDKTDAGIQTLLVILNNQKANAQSTLADITAIQTTLNPKMGELLACKNRD